MLQRSGKLVSKVKYYKVKSFLQPDTSRSHKKTMHGYGAGESRGMPVYSPAVAGTRIINRPRRDDTLS